MLKDGFPAANCQALSRLCRRCTAGKAGYRHTIAPVELFFSLTPMTKYLGAVTQIRFTMFTSKPIEQAWKRAFSQSGASAGYWRRPLKSGTSARYLRRSPPGARSLAAGLPLLMACLPLACYCGCWSSPKTPLRYQVASSSMAPTLIGPTHLATCPTCQFEFPIAVETFRPTLPTR